MRSRLSSLMSSARLSAKHGVHIVLGHSGTRPPASSAAQTIQIPKPKHPSAASSSRAKAEVAATAISPRAPALAVAPAVE